ncbi:DNA internalization-related competence protein ComEC/Rec2 [uncultured Helcococcus sp.]|uniref:DNA internalization-related competence protein ComEC/Rec2 n=1 Tax=uncultured Helcococcus sp. TaxID=1072508 RepID=UPI00263579F3|nr:DNA internalization-related competence protein ComEC/Rec2 [uncultured Helcococcus sp.]
MKRPILLILVALITGILIHEFILIDLVFVFLSISLIFIFYTKYRENTIIFIFCLIIGYMLTGFNDQYINETWINLRGEIVKVKETDDYRLYFIKTNSNTYIFYNDLVLKEGDMVEVRGRLEKIRSYNNFRSFNKSKYYRSKKIFYEIKKAKVQVVGHKARWKYGVKSYMTERIDKNLSKQGASLVKSMLLSSDKGGEITESFTNLGLAHILAISGLHLSILIGLLDHLGRRLYLNKKYYSIFIISLLIFYGYIVDFPVSFIRSIIMYGLSILTIYTLNIKDRINDMLVAMTLCLLINPFYIYSAAFYLSYASVFAIYYISPNLSRIFKKTPDFILGNLAIQLGLLPFLSLYFNKFNLITFVANLLVVPIMSRILFLSFILVIFNLRFLSYIINPSFDIIIFLAETMEYLGKNLWLSFPSLSLKATVLYFIFIYIIFNYRILIYHLKRKKKIYIVYLSGIFMLVKLAIPVATVNIIDIGQGDAILYRDRNLNILFDTGGDYLNKERAGENIYQYLIKNGVYKLDYVFISHPDIDHMGNLYYLVNKIQIGKIYANNLDDFKTYPIKSNDKFNSYPLNLEVLYVNPNHPESNETSAVILAHIFKYKLLLTGDIGEEENNIKTKGLIDFLKVSHHGSKFSTSKEFLENNKFSKALISAGYKNRYGHPNPKVLSRLKDKNIEIYRTDQEGNIEIKFRPYGYHIKRYWGKRTVGDLLRGLIFY